MSGTDFQEWWAEFTARFAAPRHINTPELQRRAYTQYRNLVINHPEAVTRDALDQLLLEKRSIWPDLGMVEQALRDARGLSQGSDRALSAADPADLRTRIGEFYAGYKASGLGRQAVDEGWWHRLRAYLEKPAEMQAQVVLRCEAAGRQPSPPKCDQKDAEYYHFAEMVRDGQVSVDVPQELIAMWRAEAERERAKEAA